MPELADLGDERSVQGVMDELRPELPPDWIAEQLDRPPPSRSGRRHPARQAWRAS
jgi:hypothetical protein